MFDFVGVQSYEGKYYSSAVRVFCKLIIFLLLSHLNTIIESMGRTVSGRWSVGWWSVDR